MATPPLTRTISADVVFGMTVHRDVVSLLGVTCSQIFVDHHLIPK